MELIKLCWLQILIEWYPSVLHPNPGSHSVMAGGLDVHERKSCF